MTGGLEKGFAEEVNRVLGEDRVAVVRHCKPGRGIRFWVEDYELPEGHEFHGRLKAGNGEEFPKLVEIARSAGDPKSFKTVSFIWMQGESDAGRDLGVSYARSFKTLMERLKSELGIERMNFVIGRISDFGLHGEKVDGWKGVRRAQVELADGDPLGDWVDTDDLNGGDSEKPEGQLHYPKEQYPILGKRLGETAARQVSGERPSE